MSPSPTYYPVTGRVVGTERKGGEKKRNHNRRDGKEEKESDEKTEERSIRQTDDNVEALST
jgi:hypothetical protein